MLYKKHLRRKLEAEFGVSIDIFPDNKIKLTVTPCSLNVSQLAKANLRLRDHLNRCSSLNDNSISPEVARQLIKIYKLTTNQSNKASLYSRASIPCPTIHTFGTKGFLMQLICNNPSQKSERDNQFVYSIGQDNVFVVTNARQKLPKYICWCHL